MSNGIHAHVEQAEQSGFEADVVVTFGYDEQAHKCVVVCTGPCRTETRVLHASDEGQPWATTLLQAVRDMWEMVEDAQWQGDDQ